MNITTINDKDTWDITFPTPHVNDIVLWDSGAYSEELPKEKLLNLFFSDIKSGAVDIPEDTEVTTETKPELIKKYYASWYCNWLENRWDRMQDDLDFLEESFFKSAEYFPSQYVFCLMRGWSADGDGHKYGIFKAHSVSDVIIFIRDQLIPLEIDADASYTILLPNEGTLSLEYLTSPFYNADGTILTDDTDAEVYEGGTIVEFYHIKPSKVGLLSRLHAKDATSNTPHAIFNNFCEGQIAKHGKRAFIDTYLDKIDNAVEHVWYGASLLPYWDVDVATDGLVKKV